MKSRLLPSARRLAGATGFEPLEPRLSLAADFADAPTGDAAASMSGAVEAAAMDDRALARVFLSDRGPGESPLLENPVIRLQPGERRLLYTWIQVAPGTRLQGVALNLASTTPGLLNTLSHSIANPTDAEGTMRWIELAGAPYGGKLGDVFENSVAVSLFTRGISSQAPPGDELFDASTGAWLFSTVEVSASAPGRTELFFSTGRALTVPVGGNEFDGKLIHYGFGDDAVNPYWEDSTSRLADATIVVEGAASELDVNPDVYQVLDIGGLSVTGADGLLANDQWPTGGDVAVEIVRPPKHGTIVVRADGAFDYHPTPGFTGQDQFAYRLVSGELVSGWTGVSIDVPPVLSIESATFSEPQTGSAIVTLTVRLSQPPTEPITVEYRTDDLDARAGDGDYVPIQDRLEFQRGEIEKSIPVHVRSDDRMELIEDVSVTIFNATGARIAAQSSARLSIRDSSRPRVFLSATSDADLAQPIAPTDRFLPGQMLYLWANLAAGDGVVRGAVQLGPSYPDQPATKVSLAQLTVASGAQPVLLASLQVEPLDERPLSLSDEGEWFSLLVDEPIELLSGVQYLTTDGGESQKPWRVNGMGARGSAFSFTIYIDRPTPPVEVIGEPPPVDVIAVIADPPPIDFEEPTGDPEGQPTGNEQLGEPAAIPQPTSDDEPGAGPLEVEAPVGVGDTGFGWESPPVEVVQLTPHEIINGSDSNFHDASEFRPHRHGNRTYFAPHFEAGVDALYQRVGRLSESDGELQVWFRQGIAARLQVPESSDVLHATHPSLARRGLRFSATSPDEQSTEISRPVLRATRRRR